MLSSMGFATIDLGIDVSAESFLEAAKLEKPDIVAMSCLLTVALDEMRRTIEKLDEAGLRRKLKVIVGGRPVSPEFAKEIGADAYGRDAIEAVRIAKDLVEERSK
jgi:5-methyltetrahydrofolate--homocysteine methyltransferase